MTLGQFRGWLLNGRSVTLLSPEQKPIGYAVAHEIPGLPNDRDVACMVAVPYQRQGFGRRLVQHLQQLLTSDNVKRLNADTHHTQFLQAVGFEQHHEEITLLYNLSHALPPLKRATTQTIQALPLSQSAPLFCQLYDASFSPHPWYQPYTVEEVIERWTAQDDMFFLYQVGQPLGFVWVQFQSSSRAIIEPIGIVPEAVGRGNGRLLLTFALHHCAQKGATDVQIGAWVDNVTAVSLYQSLGFQENGRYPHWVLELSSKPLMS